MCRQGWVRTGTWVDIRGSENENEDKNGLSILSSLPVELANGCVRVGNGKHKDNVIVVKWVRVVLCCMQLSLSSFIIYHNISVGL